MMYKVRELLKKAADELKLGNITDTAVLDAELIFLHTMSEYGRKLDRLKLITQPDAPVEEQIADRYLELISERNKGKPVQYITGRQEFMGIDLYVKEGVLIPRPDTEIVVEKVIELAAGTKGAEALNIIDMCTGTGAIAVSLAMNLKDSKVYAVDISETALECCGVNVERLGLNDRVEIIRSDLFTSVHEELLGQIDIIVSNPPYIPRDEIKQLKINVKGYEPLSALDGGEDGLEFYRRISRDGQEYLKKGGILAFEIGYEQGVYVKDIMEESGYYTGFGIEKDLAGFDRCVWGSRK